MSDEKDNLSFDFNGNSNNNDENNNNNNKPTVNVNSKGKTNGKGLLNKKLEKTIIYSVIGIVILGGVYEGVGAYQAQHDKAAILHKQKTPPKPTNAPLPSVLDQTTQSVSVQPSQVTTFSTGNTDKPNNKELKMLQAEIAKLKNKKNLESAKMGQIYASGIIAMSGNVSSSKSTSQNNNNSSLSQQINKTKQEIAQAEKEEKNDNSTSSGTGNNDSSMLKYINDAVGGSGKESSNTNSPQSSDASFTKQQSKNNLDGTIKIHNKIPNEALTIGTVIPATLVTRIDTQVPGTVKAQVNRNIYNRSGIRVIPRGSILIGSYDSQTFNGQDRVLMAFNRMIMPNGDYLRLKGMGSNGPRGAAGSVANVDNHFWTVLGSSLLVALIAQGVQQIGNNAGDSGTQNYYGNSSNSSSGLSSAGAQVLDQSLSDILQPYTNMPSTLTIPQGQRITIITNKTVLFGNQ